MTKKEFEVISGLKVSLEEFEEINKLYTFGDLPKLEFCKYFVAMGLLGYVKSKLTAIADKYEARKELYNLRTKSRGAL